MSDKAPTPAAATATVPSGIEPLLNIDGAAKLLAVSRRWVQEAVRRDPREPGSIPAYCLPSPGIRRHWRFDPVELREWLRADCPPVADWRRLYKARERERRR